MEEVHGSGRLNYFINWCRRYVSQIPNWRYNDVPCERQWFLASESLFWSYGTADLAIMDNTYGYPGSNCILDSLDLKYGNMIIELR